MRIAQVAPHMDTGGAERALIALIHGLVADDHQLSLFAPTGHLESELPPGVRRVAPADLGRSPGAVAAAAARLARMLRETRPALVHAHNPKMTTVAAIALRLAALRPRPPLLATYQAVADADQARAAWLLRRADAVVAVSEELSAQLRAAGCADVEVIGNSVAPPPALSEAQSAALDRELGLDGGPLVLSVGRLVAQKNHERLLAAARIVVAQRPDARFRIAGYGVLRPALERRTAELGLAGHVRFLGLRRDVPALLARSDLLVVSSDFEGMSVAVLEALAAGVPVVSTPVAGMHGMLDAGAGIVTDGFHAHELAAGVLSLLGDPARRAAMGTAGRAVAARHGAAAMVAAYTSRYERLLTPTIAR